MNSGTAAIPRSPGQPPIYSDFQIPFDLAQQQAALNAHNEQSLIQQQDRQNDELSRRFSRARGMSNDSSLVQSNFTSTSSSSCSDNQGGVAAIDRIGSLLDRVTDLAQTARMSFIEGDHAQSSLCLGDLQRSLTEIGELGTQSLAQVENPDGLQAATSLNSERSPSGLGHRRNLTESAVKKRPLTMAAHDADFTPFKTMRAQDGTPVNNPPLPPPSAPPMSLEGMSSAASSMPSSMAPAPPPSAPPYFHPSASTSGATSASQIADLSSAMMSSVPNMSTTQQQQQQRQDHQQQQQATHDLFSSASQQQSSGAIHSLNQSPVPTQGSFGFSFNGSLGSSHTSMGQSTPPTPGIGGLQSTRSSMNGSMMSDATGNTSHSLQMAFQQSMPSSPQEKQHLELGDAFNDFDASHHRLTSSSGQIQSNNGNVQVAGVDEAQDGGVLSSERGMSGAHVPPELKSALDRLFFDFLERVCFDINYSDSKGEHLHQILTAKKMSRSSLATESYKAFKFRIQAFTNAFHEEVERTIGENECNLKQTRAYLWTSNYIARFNESGVKEKSKGNHVWRVEARKNNEGRFEFREFKRKIIVPTQVAYHGIKWTWPLRIWDPQAPSTSIKAVFGAQNLPSWIQWKEGDHPILYGTPDASSQSCQLHITAHYVTRGHQQLVRLSATVDLQVQPFLDSIPSTSLGGLGADESSSILAPATSADQVMSHIQDSEQTMEEIGLDQAASMMAPAQMAQVMSQMNLPYTPPASFGQHTHFFTNDSGESMHQQNQIQQQQSPTMMKKEEGMMDQNNAFRPPLPTAPLPLQGQMIATDLQPHEQIQHNQIRELMARQEQAAANMQLNMPPIRRRMTDHQSMDQARSIRALALQQHQQVQDQMTDQQQQHNHQQYQEQQQQQQQQHHQAMAEAASEMMMLQQQQQQQGQNITPSSGMMSSMGITSNAGVIADLNLAPMSSMPQMASTLPHMSAASHDPMLSPALPVGFDPIANEGARLMAMQQQQQQQQIQATSLHHQQQQQQHHHQSPQQQQPSQQHSHHNSFQNTSQG